MNWCRLNRALTSNGLLLKGGCGGINPVQRLTRPSTRLSSQTPPSQTPPQQAVGTVMTFLKKIVIPSVAGSTALYALYLYSKVLRFEYDFSHNITRKVPHIKREMQVDRTNEKAKLKEVIMTPSTYYYCYNGPHRSGKSQAILEVVDELRKEGVKGVHYIRVYSPLRDALTKVVEPVVVDGVFGSITKQKNTSQDAALSQLEDIMERLAASTHIYKGDRRTTIILDGVNKLAKEEFLHELHILLESAKLHADLRLIQWILVDSSGQGLDEMKKFSASSRMRLIFWSDVSEKDAKEYLKKAFEAAGKKFDVDEVYKCVTGGRVGLLNDAVQSLKTCSTQADLIEKVTSPAVDDMEKVFGKTWPKLPPDSDKAIFQYRILRLLAENPVNVESTSSLIDRANPKYFKKKGVDCDAAIDELLKRDLLCYPDSRQIQLHSNAVKYHVLKNDKGPFDDDSLMRWIRWW